MDTFVLVLKGLIIGLGFITPASGAALSMALGVYDKMIFAINNIFKDFKKQFWFLAKLGVGIALAVFLASFVLKKALEEYEMITILFFVGLILGSLPTAVSPIKNIKIKSDNAIWFFITFILAILFIFVDSKNDLIVVVNKFSLFTTIKLIGVGMLISMAIVVPGVSGSVLLMIVGYYGGILNAISNILDFSLLKQNILLLAPICVGMVLGIFILAKIIDYLFKNYKTKTYYGITGFIVSSMIVLIINMILGGGLEGVKVYEYFIGIILFFGGIMIASYLGKIEARSEKHD